MRARAIVCAWAVLGVVCLNTGLQARSLAIEQVWVTKTSNLEGSGPIQSTPTFAASDEAAYCAVHVIVPRTGTHIYYQLTMRWYAPDKSLYQTNKWELMRDATTDLRYRREAKLTIRGTRAATLSGVWRVTVEIAFGPRKDITFTLERGSQGVPPPPFPPTRQPAPPTPRPTLPSGATWSQVVSWAKPAVVFIQGETGKTDARGGKLYASGSGVIISSDGYILTAAHVVADITGAIEVIVAETRSYTAWVVEIHPKWDPRAEGFSADVALLKISASGLAWLPLGNSDALAPEEEIRVLGYPRAGALGLGLIPATGRALGVRRQKGVAFVQIEAPLFDEGHSGGPVIDVRGRVVGIAMGTFVSGETGVRHQLAVAMSTAQEIIPPWLLSFVGHVSARGEVAGCVRV